MKRPHASDDVRARAVAAVDAGHSVADVARIVGSDPSTIRRWRRRRARTGAAHARPRPGRARLIGPEHEAALRAQLAAEPGAALARHCRRWAETRGTVVGVSAMRRAIARRGVTLKNRPSSPASRTPRPAPPSGRSWRAATRPA